MSGLESAFENSDFIDFEFLISMLFVFKLNTYSKKVISVIVVFGNKGSLIHDSIRPIWLVTLCGELAVLQAPAFERILFDPFALVNNGWRADKVGVCWREVVKASVIVVVN